MHLSYAVAVALSVLSVAQAHCGRPDCPYKAAAPLPYYPGCGCCNPCAPPPCLPPPSPYEAMAAALAVPGPQLPQPNIPPCPAPCQLIPGCGPPPTPIKIYQVPAVTLPGPETPVIELPNPCLFAPRVICHRAVVSKAVMKPNVYQRLIHVPITARFMKKSVAPIVENIAYNAVPKCVGPEAPVPMVNAPPCAPCGCCAPPPPPPCGCGCGF